MYRTSLPALVIFSILLGGVTGYDACQACYRIGTGALVGIIIGDLLITILIVAATYCLTRRALGKKGSIMKGKSKREAVQPESPYEELKAGDRGVYSELKPAYK
ncbi:TYRO protein tyrosine kinase-binding protein-like [Hemitrygon akajei]|uniref:TYRO protein tyrosine kinase-binding protein-like n=1 Tax=Hemitrygon akajei TaxID=2704970 RepID=UPI003BFA15FE